MPRPPALILKQRAKKGVPYFQYKVLEIPALRAARAAREDKPGEAEPKALHFVRAHFEDFTKKGLVGKNKGVVDKDYTSQTYGPQ